MNEKQVQQIDRSIIRNGVVLGRIAGNGGCEYIANTTLRTGKEYTSIVVQEDTVFTTITAKNDKGNSNINYLNEVGLSGETLTKGALITIPSNYVITDLELASGSVIAYK